MLTGLSRYHMPVRVVTGLSQYHGPVTVTRAGHDSTVPIVARCRDSLRQAARPAQARERLAVRPMKLSPAARCKQNPGACSALFRSLAVPRALRGTPRSPRRGPRPGPRLLTRRVFAACAQNGLCRGTAGRAKPEDHLGGRTAFVGACLPRRRVRTAPTAPRPSGPVLGSRKGNNA